MSKRWLVKEGEKWVEQDIITEQQLKQILTQYEQKPQGISILSVLASLLIGLGILSFIAANWQQIPSFMRLGLIVVIMCSFYAGGSFLYERGNKHTGNALFGIGLLSFGAGIFLIAQMYHLISNSIGSFLVWAVAGFALLYLYGSRYMFIITAVILTIAQYISVIHHQSYSILALLFTVIGLGYYVWKTKDHLLAGLFVASLLNQAIIWLLEQEYSFLWIYAILAAFYTLGDLLQRHFSRLSIQLIPLIMSFGLASFYAFFHVPFSSDSLFESMNVLLFHLIWGLCFVCSVVIKIRQSESNVYSIADWIIFLPVFFMHPGTDWYYLILLFLFCLYVLLDGYREHSRLRVNIGTILFLFSIFLSYVKLTWGFMDKSFVYMIGGCMLFALSWYLNRKNKQLLREIGGEKS